MLPFASIKLIALDLDGTLLNSDHHVSAETLRLLHEAHNRGYQIILATGKTPTSAVDVRKELNMSAPGVYSQGLIVLSADNTILHNVQLTPAIAQEALDFAADYGAVYVAYSDYNLLAPSRNKHTDILEAHHEPTPVIVESLAGYPVQKLILMHEPDIIDAMEPGLRARFDGRASVTRAGVPTMIELLPLGHSKGTGVQWLLDQMGVNPAHVLAFGDGENDISLLQLAGIGVAMGNARQVVKDSADLTTLTNDAEGVAHILRQLLQ